MTIYLPSPGISTAPIPHEPHEPHEPRTPRPRRDDAARVGLFTCEGIEALGHDLGLPLAVAAAVPDTGAHLRRLGDLRYASGVPRDYEAWPLPFDFDYWLFRDWRSVPIDARWFGRTPHPLATCVEDGELVVRLPPGVSAADFSSAFRDGLAPLRFEAVARRPCECRRRHHARRPVAVASRYALTTIDDHRPVEVRDLIAFSPRTLVRLADVASATLSRLAAPGAAA